MLELMLNTNSNTSLDIPPYGNLTAGFYGERTEASFISAASLASQIGLTAGIVETAVTPSWLAFSKNGKRLYLATRAFRHTLSWDQIYNVGGFFDILGTQGRPTTVVLRDQNAQVTIGGKLYRVRGMTVNEWNTLVVPLVQTWVPSIISKMNIAQTNGSARWMLDNVGGSVNSRQWRGWTSAITIGNNPSNSTAFSGGWSPVLELM